jgi:sulfopyruvate decarboxylase subunit beta
MIKRIEAIQDIMNTITDEIVVASCGKISREVYDRKDRPLNFYVMGSMGAALPIGMGIALSKPEKEVVVIAGDGEILMDLGSLVLLKELQKTDKIPNLELYILDNHCYQATGGQKTCSNATDFRLFCFCKVIFISDEDSDSPRIPLLPVEIKERFMKALKE